MTKVRKEFSEAARKLIVEHFRNGDPDAHATISDHGMMSMVQVRSDIPLGEAYRIAESGLRFDVEARGGRFDGSVMLFPPNLMLSPGDGVSVEPGHFLFVHRFWKVAA